MKVALNCTRLHASDFQRRAGEFLSSVPGEFSSAPRPTRHEDFGGPVAAKKYYSTSFPVHFWYVIFFKKRIKSKFFCKE